jgi:hypothetical protein
LSLFSTFSGQSATKCPGLPHWKHVLVLLLMFTRFSCSLSNRLVSNAARPLQARQTPHLA